MEFFIELYEDLRQQTAKLKVKKRERAATLKKVKELCKESSFTVGVLERCTR